MSRKNLILLFGHKGTKTRSFFFMWLFLCDFVSWWLDFLCVLSDLRGKSGLGLPKWHYKSEDRGQKTVAEKP